MQYKRSSLQNKNGLQHTESEDRHDGGSIKDNENCEQNIVLPCAAIHHHIYGTLLTAAKKNEFVKNKNFQETQPGRNSRPFKRKSRALTITLRAHLKKR